ncbi:hypothetical protein [Micromonospora sp. WMMD736]|uniref:hypothetical protein n=1 Tax=Micromonospora sp. WMMD736 TaxID=3404112 RepID=UPI003B937EC1
MPPRPYRPDALTWQVFRGSDVVRDRLLTEHQLRSSAWVRLRHDIYADARLDRDHALACRAAVLRLPPGVVVGGPSAAFLHGVEHAAAFTDDVHIVAPRPLRVGAQRGLRVHVHIASEHAAASPRIDESSSERTAAHPPTSGPSKARCPTGATRPPGPDRSTRSPLPRSGPARSAWETAVWLDPVRALAIIDTMLGRGLTDGVALAEEAARNTDRPGSRRAGWLFELADGRAQSPPESHLRARLVLGGLPRPVVQHPVRLSNGMVLHPDLAWPAYRVAVEYDGHWHSDIDQLHRDRRRLNLLVGAGWMVLHVTSRRMHAEFPAVLREVRAALNARGWRRAVG